MDNPNPMIGRNAYPDEKFSINIGCFNWANAQRDNIFNPVDQRLDLIIDYINSVSPPLDVLVILEANRPSRLRDDPSSSRSFTSMAEEIEAKTGMRYAGVVWLNATPDTFGKAFFVRPERVIASNNTREWTGKASSFSSSMSEAMSSKIASGHYFGNDVLFLKIHPVVEDLVDFQDGKGAVKRLRIIRDRKLDAAFVHFPPPGPSSFEACISLAEWIRNYPRHVDMWMGDWNTISDGAGPDIIRIVSERYNHLTKYLVDHNIITFRAFPHDIVKKPIEYRDAIVPPSEIVAEEGDSIMVRFASTLDHVFSTKERVFGCDVTVHPITDASDHALVSVMTQL